ncbi:uncharacterized protein E0L32_009090 [Thyridium curvatum]|uniref:Cytochrome P450 n=1 Tax=Thyridium curvatum TaxID=1093900 RepID=A0A507AXV3_9PEZI|nr:uncharacterized protein E0L32_009090 [Thyridium curvatum]TPX09751.1 hypothetical protein E0L32_009090 [Thyridium curvatum]
MPSLFALVGVASAALAIAALVYLYFFYVDYPKIKGIPEAHGGDLLAGHFYQLGADHAVTAERWSKENNWPVFQIRMGRRRAVILNSFNSSREWMVKNQTATVDRPWFHTFHGVVSATSAATIGTSPWNERTKKQRRVVGSFTTGPSIQKMRSLLDLETAAMISGLYYDSEKGEKEIMPHVYEKRVSLNVMTMFCYSTRFTSVDDPMLLQILEDATTIASFRSTVANPQDFIPHLRYLSSNSRNDEAVTVRARRDEWLKRMLEEARSRGPVEGATRKSVAEMLLTEGAQEGLTILDVKTILGGLMSGGFETIFSTAIIAIGVLASPAGQAIQQQAYDDIMSVYDTPEDAFERCLTEERSPYIMALVKESLRFFPPLKLLPARQTYKEFEYNGATIPKGVLVYINAQAANRDPEIFGEDADKFRPERWLDTSREIPPPYHYAYGAGSRMCTAVNFGNRVLYAIFLRLIVSFKLTESKSMPANTDYIGYKRDPSESNAIPSDFKVKLNPRNKDTLEKCLAQSEQNVAALATGGAAEALLR